MKKNILSGKSPIRDVFFVHRSHHFLQSCRTKDFIPRFNKFATAIVLSDTEERGIIPRSSNIKYCRYFETGYINLARLGILLWIFQLAACSDSYRDIPNFAGEMTKGAAQEDGALGRQPDKEAKTYYEDGKLESNVNYLNGKRHGTATEYYRNGNIKREVIYKKDKLYGVLKTYYDFGALKSEEPYKDNMLHGVLKKYTAYGELAEQIDYRYGKIDGKLKRFFERQVVQLEQEYVNNTPNGIYNEYHPNGKLKQTMIFSNGKQTGWIRTFYDNGAVRREWEAFNGVSSGDSREYYPNGRIAVIGHYENGKPEGTFSVYEGEMLAHIDEYKNGNIVKRSILNRDGKLEFVQEF